MMKKNILIKNGVVVDPIFKTQEQRDVYIQSGRIASAKNFTGADIVIDASGNLVVPGLIDFHSHVFADGTEIGIEPDLSFIPQGVTTAVDAGSTGIANFECFKKDVIQRSKMRIKAFVNLCPAGLATMKYHHDILLGLKIRISKEIVCDLGINVLKQAVNVAEKLGTRLAVHVTNPPEAMETVVKLLRPDDVLAHCYHGTGYTILDNNGKVLPAVREAQKRGVIIDAANGGNHWSFKVAEKAIAEGFYPDIISTDLTVKTLFKDPVFSMPYLMSKYLFLKMPLPEIIARCTSIPAKIMGMESEIGQLQEGFLADVAILKRCDKYICFSDTQKETRIGREVLVPQLTITGGEIVYRSISL